jgi:site-specific recombinase XerD
LVKTLGKGKRERVVRVGERALKYLRAYLRRRTAADGCGGLWTTYKGTPLSYGGGQIVFRRLRRRTGIAIAHAHRFRHTWAQTALRKGAERALVQDAMGWSSDAMVRRYGGWVRSQTAAEAMPRFAPIWMRTLFRFVEKKFLVLFGAETVDFSRFDLRWNSGLRTTP